MRQCRHNIPYLYRSMVYTWFYIPSKEENWRGSINVAHHSRIQRMITQYGPPRKDFHPQITRAGLVITILYLSNLRSPCPQHQPLGRINILHTTELHQEFRRTIQNLHQIQMLVRPVCKVRPARSKTDALHIVPCTACHCHLTYRIGLVRQLSDKILQEEADYRNFARI